ncbi:hypothetical protein HanXRQr2_Chr08g0343951 [Helianthus annuus]|uniref:Uncharacterized protein n=1 Tax=Helianthus annuus TaxID=4232 RepID=A0A9K3IFJ8_HELAN|nr:hypothetical protein HanXRQr2_Chr08g0343951 [Helianthus annuus]KAJ0902029.1 hypothetical protein HanPSC8_Chr08g0332241 [Helianthus annuus]
MSFIDGNFCMPVADWLVLDVKGGWLPDVCCSKLSGAISAAGCSGAGAAVGTKKFGFGLELVLGLMVGTEGD